MDYWSSDSHFCHSNIIKYCQRPFASVEEMNVHLIQQWNSVVKPEDTVYHLGDVAFGGLEKVRYLLEQLNGKVLLVPGNHDYPKPERYEKVGWAVLAPYVTYRAPDGQEYELGHIPPERPGDKWYLCGHVHNYWRRIGQVINVGVELWDYTPVTLEQLLAAENDGIPARLLTTDDRHTTQDRHKENQ